MRCKHFKPEYHHQTRSLVIVVIKAKEQDEPSTINRIGTIVGGGRGRGIQCEQSPQQGWVEFDLDVPPILASCSSYSAKLSSAQAESGRQWNSKNKSQTNLTQARGVMA